MLDVSQGTGPSFANRRSCSSGRAGARLRHDDQDGKTLKLSDLRGNVVALTFIYTRCPLPDFCPLMDRKFARAGRSDRRVPRAAPSKIRLISLSFDPEHDTPRSAGEACPDSRRCAPALDLRRRLPRRAGQDRRPARACSTAPGRTRSPTTSARRSSIPRASSPAWKSGRQRNKWETVDLLKTIYSLIPPARSDPARLRRTAIDLRSHFAATLISAHLWDHCRSTAACIADSSSNRSLEQV